MYILYASRVHTPVPVQETSTSDLSESAQSARHGASAAVDAISQACQIFAPLVRLDRVLALLVEGPPPALLLRRPARHAADCSFHSPGWCSIVLSMRVYGSVKLNHSGTRRMMYEKRGSTLQRTPRSRRCSRAGTHSAESAR